MSPWFSRAFPEIISSKVAYARDTYKSFSKKFSNEIEKLFSYLDSFLEVRVDPFDSYVLYVYIYVSVYFVYILHMCICTLCMYKPSIIWLQDLNVCMYVTRVCMYLCDV